NRIHHLVEESEVGLRLDIVMLSEAETSFLVRKKPIANSQKQRGRLLCQSVGMTIKDFSTSFRYASLRSEVERSDGYHRDNSHYSSETSNMLCFFKTSLFSLQKRDCK